MQHHNKNRKFGRSRSQRTALLRGLALSLVEHERISTTEAKAKELRPFIERIITQGKSDTVSSRRLIRSTLGEPKMSVIQKIISVFGTRYKDRNGGYTRVIKKGETHAGRTEAVIELV